jgi:hypothetical protein
MSNIFEKTNCINSLPLRKIVQAFGNTMPEESKYTIYLVEILGTQEMLTVTEASINNFLAGYPNCNWDDGKRNSFSSQMFKWLGSLVLQLPQGMGVVSGDSITLNSTTVEVIAQGFIGLIPALESDLNEKLAAITTFNLYAMDKAKIVQTQKTAFISMVSGFILSPKDRKDFIKSNYKDRSGPEACGGMNPDATDPFYDAVISVWWNQDIIA